MQSVKKETDGFLRLRITEETPEEDYEFRTGNENSLFEFPEELREFLGGLNGKKQR